MMSIVHGKDRTTTGLSSLKQLGAIGPLGIAESYRKYGLGRAVVEAAEYYLQQRGKQTLFIDWTDLIVFY